MILLFESLIILKEKTSSHPVESPLCLLELREFFMSNYRHRIELKYKVTQKIESDRRDSEDNDESKYFPDIPEDKYMDSPPIALDCFPYLSSEFFRALSHVKKSIIREAFNSLLVLQVQRERKPGTYTILSDHRIHEIYSRRPFVRAFFCLESYSYHPGMSEFVAIHEFKLCV